MRGKGSCRGDPVKGHPALAGAPRGGRRYGDPRECHPGEVQVEPGVEFVACELKLLVVDKVNNQLP